MLGNGWLLIGFKRPSFHGNEMTKAIMAVLALFL